MILGAKLQKNLHIRKSQHKFGVKKEGCHEK